MSEIHTVNYPTLFPDGCLCDFDGQDVVTPLDDYVNRDDPTYGYEVLDIYDDPDFTVHVLNMTSQQWMDGMSHMFLSVGT